MSDDKKMTCVVSVGGRKFFSGPCKKCGGTGVLMQGFEIVGGKMKSLGGYLCASCGTPKELIERPVERGEG